MRISRKSALLTAFVAAVIGISGCSTPQAEPAPTSASIEAKTERTVTDALGNEVTVPAKPEKIVTTHYAATQTLYDLGMTPVGHGVVGGRGFDPNWMPEAMEAELSEVPQVTNATEIFVEDIASLEPDLILTYDATEEEVLVQLQAIAPVYQFTLRGGDRANWAQRVDEIADAVNASDAAEKMRSDLVTRQENIAKDYSDVIEGKSVGIIDSVEENNFLIWGESSMEGNLLEPLGFTWLSTVNELAGDGTGREPAVSTEKLVEVFGEADLLFYATDLRGGTNAFTTALQENPLYQQLPAVQAGHVYPLGKPAIAGYTDANYSLDRVEEALEEIGS